MHTHMKNLLIAAQYWLVVLMTIVIVAVSQAQTPAERSAAGFRPDALARARPAKRAGFSLMGKIASSDTNSNKVGISEVATSATSAVHGSGTVGKISLWVDARANGDSTLGDSIITQSNDNIGIGLNAPASRLAVQGMIETTLGGYKFPDGSIQTSAAVSGLQSVSHDATLQGDGTSGSPLGVSIPLNLTGSGPGSVLSVSHTDGGTGVAVEGSVRVRGGDFSLPGFASLGVQAVGGNASSGGGGEGVRAVGGDGINGGNGVTAEGGNSSGAIGGNGVHARGGDSSNFGFGGHGVVADGGAGVGLGKRGGLGLIAVGGLGQDGATQGDAAHFVGDVDVSGNLSKGGGSFKIDHPLDPENKYLYHSFVESPDMKNIYDGTVTTDVNGDATVTLPDYFEALNRDFRYQLTVIGTFAQAIVADEITNNHFRIKTNASNVKVSWQVTGVRHDAYANRNRIRVEEEKPEVERGFYLHPEVFNQPEERGVQRARHPELMRQMNETRLRRIERTKQNPQRKVQ